MHAGITAIEMAQQKPPHAELHPMRVLFVIPKADQPLLKGENYSAHFKDFVSQCTIKNPLKRPSAAVLLSHPFLKVQIIQFSNRYLRDLASVVTVSLSRSSHFPDIQHIAS
jgi:serine/threonine protein kinase